MTNAATTHNDYDEMAPTWQLVRNAVSGAVIEYLRNVGANEADPIAQNQRQREYEDGAIYYNFTARTLNGMQGAVFRQDPEIELPTQLEYLLTNCDGNGQGIVQQSQESINENAQVGRLGLFVDMPSDMQGASLADQQNGMINPSILLYTAENIVNWRTKQVGAITMLNLIVLREYYEEVDPDNKYNVVSGVQYRTLELDEDGYYVQTLEKVTPKNQENQFEVYEPRMNGARMTEVPFVFCGSENNDYTVDMPPLKAMSDLNIAHFRNTADNEEQLYTCAQAMLVIAPSENITPEQWVKSNPNGVKFGSRRGVNVGSGGNAFLLQAQAGNALSEAIATKEEQAIKIGAQLITPTTAQTATEAKIQQGADTSVLASITNNVTAAYNKAITWCAGFLGVNDESTFKLNTDFFLSTLTAQDLDALIRTWQAGAISKSVLDSKLVQAQIIDSDVDTEVMNDEIEEEAGNQGGVDFEAETVSTQ